MANQEATGAGKAFAYGTGAGGGSNLADQEASGAGKAFAYGTGAGGRSTWQSYEMVRDTAQSLTRRYGMVRDTVRVH